MDPTSCMVMQSFWLPWLPVVALILYLYYNGQFCLLVGPPVKLTEDKSHIFFIFYIPSTYSSSWIIIVTTIN